ncbi:MAG TPA: gliding motility-associated C-terminal domain-containing protein [Cyclobacteriaceae bacterium]|nr:gliding motility-associated C-terminal domain-containing protein [Cyclobacteriaceae bacterium]HPW63784.1 gliding motility-associated C-terminal domain-containing protein [Cyclobacteriaceae bacterium]
MKKLIIILSFVFFTGNLYAQYTSRLGRFQVDEIKGCAPFTVTILTTNLITTGECTAGKPCLMSAGNGTPQQQNQFTITYPQAGTFTLAVLYQSIGADDIVITVDPNIQPEFEIYTCSGLQNNIKITDKNYDQYSIDFNNDGIIETVIPNSNNQTAAHSYGIASTFNISVKGKDINAANNCAAKVLPFTSLLTLPVPQITKLTALNPTSLKLDFTPQQNILYKLEIAVNNSATFQQFQTLYGVNTVTIPNLKTDDNFYCFRLSSFDPCTNSNTYLAPVCSHNFDLSVQNGVNRLTWASSGTGVLSTEIIRNGASYVIIPGAPSLLNDVDVICKTNYCYQVVNLYAGGVQSISLEKCGEAFTTVSPTAINNTSSVVGANGVELTWTQDPLFSVEEYAVLRYQGSSFGLAGKTTNTTYTDLGYTTEGGFCYRINYGDLCGNASQPGDLICPIRLSATLDDKNVITLRWSSLKGWRNGVSNYRIEKFDKSGGLMQVINTGTDTTWVDDQPDAINQVVQYQIIAQSNEVGLTNSVSNRLVVTKEVNLFYPTAFTPDGVGPVENETFTVKGQYIVKLELKVFDRWGSMVFYSDKNEPWNGTNNGKALPEGTYVWRTQITDLAGRNFSEGSTVVILKKKN